MNKFNWERTGEANQVVINNEKVQLDFYYANINELKFNPYNTRIYDLIKSDPVFRKMNEIELRNSDEVQTFIFNKLKIDHKEKENIKLKDSISRNGVTSYLICLEDGLLLSGNNRLSILKTMGKKYEKVRVALYPQFLSEEKIINSELALQNELDIKFDYKNMSKVIRILDLKNRDFSDEYIERMIGLEIKQNLAIGELYEEFLYFSGVPQRLDYFRNFKHIYSMLDGLNSIIKKNSFGKNERYKIIIAFFESILATDVPVQKFRDHINKISSIKLKEKREKILNKFVEKIDFITKDTTQEIRKKNLNNPEQIKNHIKSPEIQNIKIELKELILNEIENSKEEVNEIKNEENLNINDIRKKLSKSMKDFEKTLTKIAEHKFDSDPNIKEIIDEMESIIENYRN